MKDEKSNHFYNKIIYFCRKLKEEKVGREVLQRNMVQRRISFLHGLETTEKSLKHLN